MDFEVIFLLIFSTTFSSYDNDLDKIELTESVFIGVHMMAIATYVFYCADGISRIREDNRKIKMPDQHRFGKVISQNVEISCKEHDWQVFGRAVRNLIAQGLICYAIHYYFEKVYPLIYGIGKGCWDTYNHPVMWVHCWKEKATDHLLRPWTRDKVILLDPDADKFVKNKRKPVKVSTEFDGHWLAKTTAKYRGMIEDFELTWYDGYVSKLGKTDDPNTVTMFFQDADYTGNIVDGVLTWSDGDVWVKDGTLFDGDWYLSEGVQGPSRKIARVHGDRLTWMASNIETPILVKGTKIKSMAQGGMEGDEDNGIVAWSNGMQWERARRRYTRPNRTAAEASRKIKEGDGDE